MSVKFTLQIALQVWAQLDCSTSLKLAILARHGQWTEVLTAKVEPEHFINPEEYARANAAVCLLKKYPDLPAVSKEDRHSAALATWKAGEASCYHANERLYPLLLSPLDQRSLPAEFLRRVRERLLSWLGTRISDDELKTRARHGPGTTFSSSVANPTAADKYCDLMTLTPSCSIHLLNLAGTKWMDLTVCRFAKGEGPLFVPGNRHTVVPKTAMIDRNIGIEPTVNLYFQLAVGSALRARMRKHAGWDLDNAASIHREMARQGSIDGSLATMDLSNASDTLCKNLVRILFRDTGWLDVMEDLRSPKTRVGDQWHVLEKFSSMGNGYTFELESCIFAALAWECLELKGHIPVFGQNLAVFGDDIIVPSDCYSLVAAVLEWCGFEINTAKSFHTGPFRESCGGDFFAGEPVRGFYLKDTLTKNNHQRTFSALNGLRLLSQRVKISSLARSELLSFLPKSLVYGGPERLGDTVIHGLDPRFRWKDGIRWVRAVRWNRPITIGWAHFSEEARLACRLTGYGHTFGIDSRGVRVRPELVWVTDS